MHRKGSLLFGYTQLSAGLKQKYMTCKVITDEEDEKFCVCGAYADGYDYKPITISFEKSLSKGGDIMYYIIVSYYGMKKENLYDDEI